MFEIMVKKDFCASHALLHYKEGTESIHEHSFKVEARIGSPKLDKSGCAVDFLKVDEALNKIVSKYNKKIINNVYPFDDISPSSENIARHFFDTLSLSLKSEGARIISVTIWEDSNHGATYSPS